MSKMMTPEELINVIEKIAELGYPENESYLEVLISDLVYVEALALSVRTKTLRAKYERILSDG